MYDVLSIEQGLPEKKRHFEQILPFAILGERGESIVIEI
jgi:hypothetical protein